MFIIFNSCKISSKCSRFWSFYRLGHTLRGKPPGVALSLSQRLALDKSNTETQNDVNIGYPRLRLSRAARHRSEKKIVHNEKENPKLLINLEMVRQDNRIAAEHQIKKLASHYGIYDDLFPNAYFIPRIVLNIQYNSNDIVSRVFHGNIIKPTQAAIAPEVTFDTSIDLLTGKESTENSYWSLLLVNPDGCEETVKRKEYLHWFISNIPNNEIGKGEIIAPYLQPIPSRGLGYQRFIFVLYKQKSLIDFKNYQLTDLQKIEKRQFSTEEFYRNYQDNITPAGLAFYQTIWDQSVTQIYHKVFNETERVFEYDIPKPYIADQRWFPLKFAFNTYLDRYRSAQDNNKRFLKESLKQTHPFTGPEPRLRFPNAQPIKNTPSWLKYRMVKERLFPKEITSY